MNESDPRGIEIWELDGAGACTYRYFHFQKKLEKLEIGKWKMNTQFFIFHFSLKMKNEKWLFIFHFDFPLKMENGNNCMYTDLYTKTYYVRRSLFNDGLIFIKFNLPAIYSKLITIGGCALFC